jgi:hypothetical protein
LPQLKQQPFSVITERFFCHRFLVTELATKKLPRGGGGKVLPFFA